MIEVEGQITKFVSKEVDKVIMIGGAKLGDELVFSVACLFLARATAMIHMWTGEPVDMIKKRLLESYDYDLKQTLIRMTRKFGAASDAKN